MNAQSFSLSFPAHNTHIHTRTRRVELERAIYTAADSIHTYYIRARAAAARARRSYALVYALAATGRASSLSFSLSQYLIVYRIV